MDRIRCFLVEDTNRVVVSLRRYARWAEDRKTCSGPTGYCNVSVEIDVIDTPRTSDGKRICLPTPPTNDARWPQACPECGYEFQSSDEWQINQDPLYAPAPGNDPPDCDPGPWPIMGLPVGAMFFPSWLQPIEGEPFHKGYLCPTDGRVLIVITPDNPDGTGKHQWIVDQYCSNCDRKGEIHHCWCRTTNAPWITVNKTPPTTDDFGTCGAGAGSIYTRMPDGWHGFLTNGYLHT